ncbi:MAG: hypothetical protein ACXVGN_05915 [Mycobacteriaceae bacterium]
MVRLAIGILATLLVLEYVLLPQIAGARQTLRLLSGFNGWWLALGLIAEVASLLAYARLSQQALPWSRATALRLQCKNSPSACHPRTVPRSVARTAVTLIVMRA